jgi:hypothetical protein
VDGPYSVNGNSSAFASYYGSTASAQAFLSSSSSSPAAYDPNTAVKSTTAAGFYGSGVAIINYNFELYDPSAGDSQVTVFLDATGYAYSSNPDTEVAASTLEIVGTAADPATSPNADSSNGVSVEWCAGTAGFSNCLPTTKTHFSVNNAVITITANQVYTMKLYSRVFNAGNLSYGAITSSGIDPYIGITSSTLSQYSGAQLDFSPGVIQAAPTGIPESKVWAMMLIGVSMIGGALRRRQRVRRSGVNS